MGFSPRTTRGYASARPSQLHPCKMEPLPCHHLAHHHDPLSTAVRPGAPRQSAQHASNKSHSSRPDLLLPWPPSPCLHLHPHCILTATGRDSRLPDTRQPVGTAPLLPEPHPCKGVSLTCCPCASTGLLPSSSGSVSGSLPGLAHTLSPWEAADLTPRGHRPEGRSALLPPRPLPALLDSPPESLVQSESD